MFGISLIEFLIVIFFAILFIKPSEYPQIFAAFKDIYRNLRKTYLSCGKELEKLKKDTGISDIDKELRQDIANADSEIKQIIGDDGKEYDSYDISDLK